MQDPGVSDLVLNLILYICLPTWVIAGFADWWCHRKTKIEETSGLKESLMHSLMGLQVGFPIVVSLFFEVNVLILLVCLLVLISHEIVAHHDVVYSSPVREITIWEVHAHAFLSTIPFYIFALIVVRRWETFLKMITLDWSGELGLELRTESLGGDHFVPVYLVFMLIVGVLPYVEENLRCWRASRLKPNQ